MTSIETCRLCKLSNYETPEPLAKYSVRHYAHFSCGLKRWGADFLNKLPLHEIGQIPYRLVDEFKIRQHPRFAEWEAYNKRIA